MSYSLNLFQRGYYIGNYIGEYDNQEIGSHGSKLEMNLRNAGVAVSVSTSSFNNRCRSTEDTLNPELPHDFRNDCCADN